MRPRPFDLVVAGNLGLWALGARFLFRRPRVLDRADLSAAELFLYASVVALAAALLWRRLRRLPWPPPLLALVQLALLASVGGYAVVGEGGRRVYDLSFLSVPADAAVHFLSAAVATLAVGFALEALGQRPRRLEGLIVVFLVLGGGAAWEILEYAAKTTFTEVGVGAYDNNMRDLVANLAGALSTRFLPARWRRAVEGGGP